MPVDLWVIHHFQAKSSRPYVKVSDPGTPGKMDRLNLSFFWRRVYNSVHWQSNELFHFDLVVLLAYTSKGCIHANTDTSCSSCVHQSLSHSHMHFNRSLVCTGQATIEMHVCMRMFDRNPCTHVGQGVSVLVYALLMCMQATPLIPRTA